MLNMGPLVLKADYLAETKYLILMGSFRAGLSDPRFL